MEGGTDINKCSVLCCTTSKDVCLKSKLVLNVMLELKIDLCTAAIPPPCDRD